MPQSVIGSRADLLIEAVVLAELLAIPVLLRAIRAAREGDVRLHKGLQLSLATIFAVATIALEVDIRMAGGMAFFAAGGRYEGTMFLDVVLYGHLAVAAVNAALWSVFPIVSWRRFRAGMLPGRFSALHRTLGWWAVLAYALTSGSGLALYVVGFVL
ncbi:MAG: DUF420 domain-containing protein [Nannocystaceae bacterium]|nr:DUF420 domain-containing protein [Nannocystaceae bacterium]